MSQNYKVSFIHYGEREGIGKQLEQELDFVNPIILKDGKGGFEENYHSYIEILLRYARECYDQQTFFEPELDKNDVLILDRGIDTITAYALATLSSTFPESDMNNWYEWIKKTIAFWHKVTPDLTLYLAQDWKISVERAEKRDCKKYSLEKKLFLPYYVEAFEYVANNENRIKKIDITDCSKSDVSKEALLRVKQFIKEDFNDVHNCI